MRRLTIDRVAMVVVLGLIFVIAARQPLDTDLWWHLRAGRDTLDHGVIRTDPFSFTAFGKHWIDHSWGSEVLMSWIWAAAGRWGMALYTPLLAVAGMWLASRTSTGSAFLRGPVLLLGGMAASIFWTPRPQMISFLFTAVLLVILHLHKREGIDRLWLVPLLMALWANLHAGFAIGFILLLGSVAGELIGHLLDRDGADLVPWAGVRRLALVSAASVVTVCANPYGWHILGVPFQTVGMGALRDFIAEWRSPDFHQPAMWPFALLLMALVAVLGASRRRLDWTDFCLAAGTALMGLLAVRNVAVFALVAVPVISRHLIGIAEDRGWRVATPRPAALARPQQILSALLVVLVVAAGAAKLVAELTGPRASERAHHLLPIDAADHLEQMPVDGPMFNSYNFGGYLIYRLPDRPVFVDGRTDLYGDRFLAEDYMPTAQAEPGWQETLDRYDIAVVVMENESHLAEALREDPGWVEDYHDDVAAIFVRS